MRFILIRICKKTLFCEDGYFAPVDNVQPHRKAPYEAQVTRAGENRGQTTKITLAGRKPTLTGYLPTTPRTVALSFDYDPRDVSFGYEVLLFAKTLTSTKSTKAARCLIISRSTRMRT